MELKRQNKKNWRHILDTRDVVSVNQSLIEENLVIFTWGNASAKETKDNLMYIKPSGVPFSELNSEKISVVDISTGKSIKGLKPSIDSPTHLEIYRHFENVGGIIHTHSKYCTIFAQSKMPIPCLGTTHADYFYGDIPVVDDVSSSKLDNYEENAGKKIIQHFKENKLSYKNMPAALLPSHGVFVWGETIFDALENAVVLENIAEMAYKTLILSKEKESISQELLDRHYFRKHGADRYYGQ